MKLQSIGILVVVLASQAAAQDKAKPTQAEAIAAIKKLGGYVDVDKHENVIGKITPLMVMSHPKVHSAREEHRSLQSRAIDRPAKRENAESIKTLETSLSEIRDGIAAVA